MTDYELTCLVDFVQVTFRCEVTTIINQVLNLSSLFFKHENRGRYGYHSQNVFDSIYIYESAEEKKEEMGTHLFMSGEACRLYDYYLQQNKMTWFDFFSNCLEYSAKFTRLDLAIDNKEKTYFKIRKLIQKVKSNELVSKFKKSRNIETIRIATGKTEGNTLYIGSPSSSIQLRFYEKNYEQAQKLNVKVEDLPEWNRFEIQLRDDKAQIAVENILNTRDIKHITLSILNTYARFVNKQENDTQRSRWPMWRPWNKFIDNASKISLSYEPEKPSVERKFKWLVRQGSNAIAMFEYLKNQTGEEYIEAISKHAKFENNEFDLIDEFLKSGQTLDDLEGDVTSKVRKEREQKKLDELLQIVAIKINIPFNKLSIQDTKIPNIYEIETADKRQCIAYFTSETECLIEWKEKEVEQDDFANIPF